MGRIVLALSVLLLVSQGFAASPILDLKQAVIAGTGCSGATVSRLAGDVLNIKTPGLSLDSSQGSQISRKACSIAIPFKLKENQKMIVTAGRVSVALNLKRGAVLRSNAEVFTAGTQGARTAAIDNGPKNQLSLLKLGSIATACGEDGVLRTNLSQVLTAKTGQSLARINGAILRLQVVKCI